MDLSLHGNVFSSSVLHYFIYAVELHPNLHSSLNLTLPIRN